MLNSNKRKKNQRRLPMLLMTVSIAMMVTLVSSAVSAGPFLIQSAWALPYVSSVSVSPSSTEKTKGETATYTVTASRASGAGSGDINLSFQSSSIPSSAATFSNTKVSFGNGGGNSKSVTLTINTNDLSIQEHSFTVKGTKSNAASDSATSGSTKLTVVKPPNQKLTANAGSDQTVNEGASVSLDGSASSNADGTIASYSWTQTAGTSATLSGATSKTPSFTAPDVGANGDTLTFELTVNDGNGHTATDTVDIGVQNVIVNQAPTANAGSDQSVSEGQVVHLDGSASTDPDSDTLTYAWTQTAGTSATLSGATSKTPSFTAPDVGANGDTLTFELTVNDGNGHTATDTVDIGVQNVIVNQAPTANAGSDQSVSEGQVVHLDGSASTDPDSDTLTYAWTQTAGTSATLSGATSKTPSFTAPDVGANGDTLTFELTVNDGNGHTATDTVDIGVQNVIVNQAPTANAGSDQSVSEGQVVHLDGSASTDPDSDTLTYAWTQTAGTSATLSGADSATPSFTAPDVGANGDTLTFELTVTDNDGATATDTIGVTVNNVNQAPVAKITANPTAINEGGSSALDATTSSDPDCTITTYEF